LVVAINSDRTVRALKEAGRPLINQDERAEVLGAMRAVTYVTIFDEVSPRSLIAELLPDFWSKAAITPPMKFMGAKKLKLRREGNQSALRRRRINHSAAGKNAWRP